MYYVIQSVACAPYHFSQRRHPRRNLPVSDGTYWLRCLTRRFSFHADNRRIVVEVRRLNWASYLLAIAIVGLEVGFLLAYDRLEHRLGRGPRQRGCLAASGSGRIWSSRSG